MICLFSAGLSVAGQHAFVSFFSVWWTTSPSPVLPSIHGALRPQAAITALHIFLLLHIAVVLAITIPHFCIVFNVDDVYACSRNIMQGYPFTAAWLFVERMDTHTEGAM